MTTAELGGTEVTGGTRISDCGCGVGEVGRGEPGGGDVDRSVAIIGEVVVITGEEVATGAVVSGAEIGSEVRGGDGSTGSSGCDPSPPTTPRPVALLEISESAVEAAVFEAAARRAFF